MALDVAIGNKTTENSSDIYWICFGLDGPGTDANWSYVSVDAGGNASLEQFSVGQNCAPLFNTVDAVGALKGLPKMWSGQFLFTFGGRPNVFNIVKSTSPDFHGIGVQTPPFTPGTADAETIFVVVEFTFSGDIWCDCTIVDYFCAPVALTVVGDTTRHNGIMKSSSNRSSIFTQIAALGSPWSSLIMKNGASDSDNVRVLGPQHGVQAGLISANIYHKYVDACWSNFASTGSNTLTVNCPKFNTYVGQTDATTGKFTFKRTGEDDVVIAKPAPGKAYDIFGCVGTLNAPNNTPLGEIAAILGASLNRTVLKTSGSDVQPDCTVADFYKVVDGVTNEYASVVHANYESGIYAFPFDDVCSNNNPLIQVSNPTQMTIELSKWS